MFDTKRLARIEKKNNKLLKKEAKYKEKYGVLPQKADKKEKNKLKYLFKFLPYLKPESKNLAIIITLMCFLIAVAIFWPMALTYTVDSLLAGDPNAAIKYAIIYTGLGIVISGFYFTINTLATRTFMRIAHNIRIDLINQLSKTKISKFNETSSGEILSRINQDPNNFCTEVESAITVIPSILRQIGRVCLAFTFHWIIGVIIVLGGLLIFVVSNYIIKKQIRPANSLARKIDDNYVAQSNEMVRGIRDIKNLNIFSHFFAKFRMTSLYKRNADTNNKSKEVLNEEITYGVTIYSMEMLLYIACIMLVISGDISLGIFSTLLIYDYDMFYTFVNLSRLNNFANSMEVNAKRMYELFDDTVYQKESFGTHALTSPKGKLTFDKVSFGFNEKSVFSDLSFEIKPGECIGIVGRSGEGKSTILNLIPRIYDVDSGKILIDDIDVKNLTCQSLRETVSVVPQAPYIFNMSIRDNLKLVKQDATEEEIRNACKKASILDFILSKEQGFDTIVGEGGVMLSGGQKQRLAIARAFLKNSKILLLDEATSALDNESQAQIKNAIKELKKSCTIIIVAHRLSTVSDCDRIFVLDDHKLAAAGPHNELINTCPVYQNLYKQED